MQFRPLLLPTLVSIPALIILVVLGTWQVQRLNWKTALIEQYTARSQSDSLPITALKQPIEGSEFQRVGLTGRFAHDQEIYLTGRTYEGNAGFHVVTPFVDQTGRAFLVNRGWVSEAYRAPEQRAFSVIDEEISFDGIVRLPQRKGYFVPENEPDNGFWFTLKPDEIAAHLGRDTLETAFYIDAVRGDEVITLPIAAELKIDVSNPHLNYAMTWYGLALALLGVYFAYHHGQGRLRFGPQQDT